MSKYFQIVICLFLMYKFNPFREHKLDRNDGRIIFTSSVFMITNVLVGGNYKDLLLK
jgi:hypothetical protein